MARYTIDFTTNANRIIREIEEVNRKVAQVARTGKSVRITLDPAPLKAGLDATFRQLDKQIESMQRKLSKLQIGSKAFRSTAASLGFREGQRERGQLIAEPLRLRGQAQSFDEASAVRLNKELQAARIEASQLAPNTGPWIDLQKQIGQINAQLKVTDRLAESIQMQESLGAFAPGSLNALEAKLTVLRNRAREIAPDTTEWKQLNKEILDVERGIEKQTRRPLTGGQRLGAAGGAFLYGGGLGGGVGSALGGIAGGLAGGVPGAFAGAAIGQAVDNLGQYAAAMANLISDSNKAKIALAGVTKNVQDYDNAVKVATEASASFSIPIVDATRQFTRLQASVVGAGFETATTEKVFNGIAAAVVATGGNIEDLNGALQATSQVFSKGKVTAEELRGQIGERLPGAFTIFAQSIGKTPQDLDEALKKGQVSLSDFERFTEELFRRYGKTAETLATSPENAGMRLRTALQFATLTFAGSFQQIGAGFQNYAASLLNFTIDNEKSIKRVVTVFAVGFNELGKVVGGFAKFLVDVFNKAFSSLLGNLNIVLSRVEEAINRAKGVQALSPKQIEQFQRQATQETTKRFGLKIGGLNTGLVVDNQGASQFYNKYFNQLIDAASGAAKNTKYTDKLQKTLFPEFKPTEFGSGLGPEGAGAAGADGSAEKKKKTRLQAYSSKMIEVLRARLKEETLAIQTSDQLNARQKELNIASLEYEYGLKIIEEQLKEVSKEKGKMSAADAKLAMAEANQTAASERSSLKYEYNKAVLGDLSNIAEDYEKKIAELTLSINALNASEGEATNVQKAELMLFEQLKGVKEKDIPLTEARRKKIMELAAELDRLLGIEKEITREKELSQALEAKRTETGMIGGGLRAGFTGEAASVFEQAMIDTKGDVDYATQLANVETAAMQLRSVFEGLQGAIQGVSSAFANVLTEGVAGMISGTATAKEVFASFLQSVGQALSQAASQMIATYIAIGIAKMFAGLGGGGENPAGSGGGISDSLPGIRQYAGGMGGGGAPGSMPFAPPAFANGGIVTGPTLSLIGEGRYNEAIVPLPDGKSIPVQLGGRSARDLMGNNAPGMPATPSLNMKFETTKINGVEYVSREQLEMAMAETRRASISGGAKQGMAMTLDKIKQSPSTRSRIGMR